MLLLGKVESAYAYADYNARSVRVYVLKIAAGVFHSFVSRAYCKLGEAVHSAALFFIYGGKGVEVLYCAYALYVKIRAVELVYLAYTQSALFQTLAKLRHVVAQRVYSAHSCYYNSFHSALLPLFHYIESPPEISIT